MEFQLPSIEVILAAHPGWLDEAISPKEAADMGDTTEGRLANLRNTGGGPKFSKQGSRVTYTRRWVLEWLHAGMRTSTSDRGPNPNQPKGRARP